MGRLVWGIWQRVRVIVRVRGRRGICMFVFLEGALGGWGG